MDMWWCFRILQVLAILLAVSLGSTALQAQAPTRMRVMSAEQSGISVVPALPTRPPPSLDALPESARSAAQELREIEVEQRALRTIDESERESGWQGRMENLGGRALAARTSLIRALEHSAATLTQVGWLELAEARALASLNITPEVTTSQSIPTPTSEMLESSVQACRHAEIGSDTDTAGWARMLEADALTLLQQQNQARIVYQIAAQSEENTPRRAAIHYLLAEQYVRDRLFAGADSAFEEAATLAEHVGAFDIWSASRLKQCELALGSRENPVAACLRMFDLPEHNEPIAGQGMTRLRLIAAALDRGIPSGALDSLSPETRALVFRALSASYERGNHLRQASVALRAAANEQPVAAWLEHAARLDTRQLTEEEEDEDFATRAVMRCARRASFLHDHAEFLAQEGENTRTVRFDVRFRGEESLSTPRTVANLGPTDAAAVMQTCLSEPLARPHGPASQRHIRHTFVLHH